MILISDYCSVNRNDNRNDMVILHIRDCVLLYNNISEYKGDTEFCECNI